MVAAIKRDCRMKKFKIDAPVDYVMGHLKYGHYEGEVEIPEEDEEDFLKSPLDYLNNNDLVNLLDLKVDEFEIEGCGDIYEINYEEV